MTDDELERRRLAELGLTPEAWDRMMQDLADSEPVEPPPDDTPGLITGMLDGSVWQNDEHGVPHQLQPPDAERPDADVHDLAARRRDAHDEGPESGV